MKLTFLGGAETVTGSKILLETKKHKLLIDCGLFQGLKELRLKNRRPLSINYQAIDAVFLTHAHLDHSGFLPVLVKNGFKGKIYCTAATRDLAKIILLDSGKIQEEEAQHANEKLYTKHKKAEPLYTAKDALKSMEYFHPVNQNIWQKFTDEIQFKLVNSGHILGSSIIEFKIDGKKLVFSGDLGRSHPIILNKYQYIHQADYVIVESTYGNRLHPSENIKNRLLKYILKTYEKKGILIIPTFSVERAQEIIFYLSELKAAGKLPKQPIYLDSPMALNATEVYFNHKESHKLSDKNIENMIETVHLIKDVKTSKAVVQDKNPKIVLAGSGMITGGRVLHYLDHLISNEKNSILIVGYQAEGTRGRSLLRGEHEIKFFGKYHSVKAEIFEISAFSGHADQNELLDWLSHFEKPPKLTFINHGEIHQSRAFKLKVKSSLNWQVTVAKLDNPYYLN
ncbi:MAG: MBL fold metallo-hydrolase [Lutibacter sp.]